MKLLASGLAVLRYANDLQGGDLERSAKYIMRVFLKYLAQDSTTWNILEVGMNRKILSKLPK